MQHDNPKEYGRPRILLAFQNEGWEQVVADLQDRTELECSHSAYDCLNRVAFGRFDLVIVACAGEASWGAQLCRSLRSIERNGHLPIVLWAPGRDVDWRIDALKSGADEVITDPVLTAGLVIALGARLHRQFAAQSSLSGGIRYGGMELEPAGYRVRLGGRAIALSPLQTRLLEKFMQEPHKVFSRDELARDLWADRPVDPRTINTAVVRLGRILKSAAGRSPIRTVRGAGYALDAEVQQNSGKPELS